MDRPRQNAALRFGYTLNDLHRLAEYAARDCRWAARIPWAERLDLALSAAAEHLYRVAEPPTWVELRNTAWNALTAQVRKELRHHGFDWTTGRLRVGFIRYWSSAAVLGSPEDAVVERLARQQIWRRLHPTLREALWALAECEDYGLAADKLGVSRAVLAVRVSRGRAEFLKWWHEHEEPSRLYSRHRPRTVKRRPATRSITERERYQRTRRTGDPERPTYGRARRVELAVSDAELARRYYTEHITLEELAREYHTSHYTIRRRINAARARQASRPAGQ